MVVSASSSSIGEPFISVWICKSSEDRTTGMIVKLVLESTVKLLMLVATVLFLYQNLHAKVRYWKYIWR